LALQIPTTEPDTITAGDSLEWDRALADFPASEGWELSYQLRTDGGEGAVGDLDFAATASGDSYEVRVLAAATTNLIPGPYRLHARVTDGTTTKSWLVRRVIVHADPVAAGAKSHARVMRDALRTALQTAATDGAYLSVSVNGRSVTYARDTARKDLANYELLCAIEENPTGSLSHAVEFVRG
jgi:hypothetical protein